jgi:hypothetical protein
MDPNADPDPAIFVMDLPEANKKLIFLSSFSSYYFLKVHLHHFSKTKVQKKSQNSRNQGFSYYFCLMIEVSGSNLFPVQISEWSMDTIFFRLVPELIFTNVLKKYRQVIYFHK